MDEAPFHASSFSKNRERLLEHEVAYEFLQQVISIAREERLLSSEHFSVDGTLIESWASLKSIHPKTRQKGVGRTQREIFVVRGERTRLTRAVQTRRRVWRRRAKGRRRMCFSAHVVTENRSGLVVDVEVTQATGTAEVEAATEMLGRMVEDPEMDPKTLGADMGYHCDGMVRACRDLKVRPHIAERSDRKVSGLDQRTTRHESYRISQRKRKLCEEIFGYAKSVGGKAKSRFVGLKRDAFDFLIRATAYNIICVARVT